MSELCEKCGVEHCYRVKEPGESVKQCGAYKPTMEAKAKPEYIEREALIADIDAAMEFRGMGLVVGQTMKRYIKRQHAADVAPVVHGRWMDNEDYMFCSCCGMQFNYCDNDTQDFHYCPNCGARMDGDG